jgi:hypothetical protein
MKEEMEDIGNADGLMNGGWAYEWHPYTNIERHE